MIGLSEPIWLAAIVAWALALSVLAHRQGPALKWIRDHVAPRFRGALTRYGESGAFWHFVFLFFVGGFGILAAAGPYRVVAAEKQVTAHTVLLVLDASLSMGAGDTEPHPGAGEPPSSRFAQATLFASELVTAMPDAAFGLISFSGVTVVHSTPTHDHRALRALLETLSVHVNLTLSGTRYSQAFDAMIHTVQHQEGSYQAVILSDGELPQSDTYDEAIAVLAELGVPVHTVAFGTLAGEQRVIYEPDDVIAKVAEKRVARRYHTRRVDRELAAISQATGGVAEIVERGFWAGDLVPVLTAAEPTVALVAGQDKEDLAHYPLSVFLLGFLIETLVVSRRPRRSHQDGRPVGRARQPATAAGTVRRAVQQPAVAALFVASLMLLGCGPRILVAHWHNELGVELFDNAEYAAAEARFEKAMSYKVREHVPLYNLGKNSAAQEEYAVAHDFYQEAMLVAPRLVEAHFNDGHALYLWGEQEIDREECRFDRARQLWTQAARRFRHAVELAGQDSVLGGRAERNASVIEGLLGELDELAEACASPPPPPPPESGEPPPESCEHPPESGEPPPPESGEPPPPESGEPPPPEPPPSGPGAAGGSPEEGEGQGGGALNPEEQEEIRAALERIQQEAASASGYRQSEHQQITPETVGKASGLELWW